MTDGWVRATQTNVNNNGFFGYVPMISVAPGQTVLKAWWNVGMYYLDNPINVYPPGSSICRVGVAWINLDTIPAVAVTPISDASADWMAITTLNPEIVQLSRATDVAWQINWSFHIDEPIKSMRRNDTADDYGLMLSYEFSLNDETSGFTINGWWASIDALIRTP